MKKIGGNNMAYKKLSLLVIFICLLTFIVPAPDSPKSVKAFSPQVIQHGAVGDDVIELQSRLQYVGFYNGDIDAVFGWGTYWALRNFQYEFGMKVDGIAGSATKKKLVKASKNYGGARAQGNVQQTNTAAATLPQGFSQNDVQLMANAVYGEARGEPYEGKVAVAAVILNRVQSSTFPNTVSGVIFEPRAFTAVADGQIWMTPDETAKEAVMDAINGWDPSGNATYYFNPDTATSAWIWSRPQIKRIGKHVFAK